MRYSNYTATKVKLGMPSMMRQPSLTLRNDSVDVTDFNHTPTTNPAGTADEPFMTENLPDMDITVKPKAKKAGFPWILLLLLLLIKPVRKSVGRIFKKRR